MPDTETCAAFHAQNQWVRAGGVVLFGADFFAALPVAELNSYFQVESAVYNRSVPGLSVFEAEQLLDVCVLELHPSKVFVNLGERDVTAASLETVEAAAAQLEWLLYQIHSRAPPSCRTGRRRSCTTVRCGIWRGPADAAFWI